MDQPVLTISKQRTGAWEYELNEDYVAHTAGQQIVVPSGFSYDGATIPSVAWQAFYTPFDPIIMGPSLIHDWLYSNHQTTRTEADNIYHDLLLGNGVPEDKARLILVAISVFGEEYWRNTRSELDYLIGLYSRHEHNPNRARYRFPLQEMGLH